MQELYPEAVSISEQNVALNRRYIEAFNSRDIDAFIAYCDPSIEFHSVFAAVGGAVYHGHDGLRDWHRDFEEAWGGKIRLDPEAYFDLGEHTLGFYVLHARGRHSGAEAAMPMAHAVRWRDGRAVWAKSYIEREVALSDLGVSANKLQQIEP
jgi:ketosteroid isomerase-like protein